MEGALFDFSGVVRARRKGAPKRRQGGRDGGSKGREDMGGKWRRKRE